MHVNQILKQYFHSCMLDMRAASVKTEIEYRAEIIQYHSFLCLVFFFLKSDFILITTGFIGYLMLCVQLLDLFFTVSKH